MTSPGYLDHIPDSVVELFHHLHAAIIADAGQRVAALKSVTGTAAYQVYRAQEVGAYYDVIVDEMAKAAGMSRDMLADLFNDAGVRTLRSDDALHRAAGKNPRPLADSPELQNILRAGVLQTMGVFRNLTQSAAHHGSEQLGQLLDEAWLKVASGAFTYDQAIKSAIVELGKSGVAAVRYLRQDGRARTDNIDVVVRRAVLTGINQSACALQLARMAEMGTEFVETTAHAGARDTHEVWQGRVFRLVGNDRYPNFYDETGYGTVAGLGGVNCRHGFYPFYPGISKPANTAAYLEQLNNATVTLGGRDIKLNEAYKVQRNNEREIRAWKRVVHGLEAAGQDYSYEQGELRAWQAAQRRFVKETGLHRDYTRERAGRQYAA